jgi:hypothetical protein
MEAQEVAEGPLVELLISAGRTDSEARAEAHSAMCGIVRRQVDGLLSDWQEAMSEEAISAAFPQGCVFAWVPTFFNIILCDPCSLHTTHSMPAGRTRTRRRRQRASPRSSPRARRRRPRRRPRKSPSRCLSPTQTGSRWGGVYVVLGCAIIALECCYFGLVSHYVMNIMLTLPLLHVGAREAAEDGPAQSHSR